MMVAAWLYDQEAREGCGGDGVVVMVVLRSEIREGRGAKEGSKGLGGEGEGKGNGSQQPGWEKEAQSANHRRV